MKLIILDRDGVINVDSTEYIKTPDEWIAIPGSLEAIAKANRAGYKIAVATNQSGIARNYYDEAMLTRIHDKMHAECAEHGAVIDKVVHCPHLPDAGCACRKPAPGLLLQIANHYSCSLENVPFIGDKMTDIQAAISAGAKPLFINPTVDEAPMPGIEVFRDLQAAIAEIISE